MRTHGASAARRLGSRRLRHRARLVADLLRRRRPRADRGVHARGVRRRHHVLRHRQRLRARRGGARVGRDPRRLPARLVHARDQGLLPDVRRATAASRASRSTSRSTPRSSACGPTTSTSTSATATTTTRRSRRRCRRSPRSSRRARRATSASASGRRTDPGRARPARRREVRVQPAAVLGALARARGRGDPAVRAQRHLADRLVAARPGRADRQVPAGRARRRRARARRRARWAASSSSGSTTTCSRRSSACGRSPMRPA